MCQKALQCFDTASESYTQNAFSAIGWQTETILSDNIAYQ